MGYGWDLLNTKNVGKIVEKLQDRRELPQELKFLNRTARVDAVDDEITLRLQNSVVQAADIIASDSPAIVRALGPDFSYEKTQIAKIKHGFALSESQMLLLARIEGNAATPSEIRGFGNVIARATKNLILGIEQRMETMIIGMLLDGYSYSRMGINLSGSWGMPSSYKINASPAWSSASTGKPVSNLIAARLNPRILHGQIFNRATMSTQALTYAIESDEFKARYIAGRSTLDNYRKTAAEIYTDEVDVWASVLATMTGYKSIELYDGMYREPSNSSTIKDPQRFLPENKVLITNSADDNGVGWDWANGVVIESVLGKLGGSNIIGSLGGGQYGPVAYSTQANPALNPPGIVTWAVVRGAPRKLSETASSVITAW